MYLGSRADGGARIANTVFLANGNGRTDPVDFIDIRFLHPFEKLPRIGRQRFNVAPLAFGIHSVKSQRRLSGTTDTSNHDELLLRKRDINVFKVVGTRAADRNVAASVHCGRRHCIAPSRSGIIPPREPIFLYQVSAITIMTNMDLHVNTLSALHSIFDLLSLMVTLAILIVSGGIAGATECAETNPRHA